MIIRTGVVEFEILPEISIFMGKKNNRGVDVEAIFREWDELTPSGKDAIMKVMKEMDQIIGRLKTIMTMEECKEFLQEHGVEL